MKKASKQKPIYFKFTNNKDGLLCQQALEEEFPQGGTRSGIGRFITQLMAKGLRAEGYCLLESVEGIQEQMPIKVEYYGKHKPGVPAQTITVERKKTTPVQMPVSDVKPIQDDNKTSQILNEEEMREQLIKDLQG